MASSSNLKLAALESFLKSYPGIIYVPPTSSNFDSLRSTYMLDYKGVPLAVVRPQSAEDVAALVSYSTVNSIQFVIRSGGNNIFGLSSIKDALMIDMRDIAYVKADKDRASAKLGGGINSDIAAALSEEGLATAIGSVPFIGYVGWSSYGGYGPFSANYGLGLDNIIGAKVVTWKGELVDADQRMLMGIRGAGGFVGVIAEVTVKVYPLKKILAGVLILDSQDISTAFQNFNREFTKLADQGLPKELGIQPLAVNTPHGKSYLVGFAWSSDDHEKGREILAQIESLGNVAMNTVQAVTVSEYSESIRNMVPPAAYGSLKSITMRKITEEVGAVIGKNLEKMPLSLGTGLSIHDLHGPSASPTEGSVFGIREPHFVIEMVATTMKQEDAQEALGWAAQFHNDLSQTDAENIFSGTYISLTSPEEVDLSRIYGSNHETVLELKREYDPHNVFKLAVPMIG